MQTKLDPEGIRTLARRLCGDAQFRENPISCVLEAITWLDRVIGDAEPGTTVQNDLVRRLGEIINQKGASFVAEELGVSLSALKTWQHGTVLSRSNRTKIEKFLDSQTAPSDAAGAEQLASPGELFGQEPKPEPQSVDSATNL
jgi:hypothetical protein